MNNKLKELINNIFVIIKYQDENYYDVVRIDEFSAKDERINTIRDIIRKKAGFIPVSFRDIEDFTDIEIFTGNDVTPVPPTAEILGVDTKKEAWKTALLLESIGAINEGV